MVPRPGIQISYDSPKSEYLKIFDLGETTHDHLVILPTKGKGRFFHVSVEAGAASQPNWITFSRLINTWHGMKIGLGPNLTPKS